MGGFEPVFGFVWNQLRKKKKKTPQGVRGCFSHIFATQITDMAMRAGAEGSREVVRSLPTATESELEEMFDIEGWSDAAGCHYSHRGNVGQLKFWFGSNNKPLKIYMFSIKASTLGGSENIVLATLSLFSCIWSSISLKNQFTSIIEISNPDFWLISPLKVAQYSKISNDEGSFRRLLCISFLWL